MVLLHKEWRPAKRLNVLQCFLLGVVEMNKCVDRKKKKIKENVLNLMNMHYILREIRTLTLPQVIQNLGKYEGK